MIFFDEKNDTMTDTEITIPASLTNGDSRSTSEYIATLKIPEILTLVKWNLNQETKSEYQDVCKFV